MNKNEYRRAFIMLRAVQPGYGGHVRLEARTLSGSLYFIVTAPEGSGELTALLAGQRNGVYSAAPLGVLRRDRRGQLTLARQIDPRNIGGLPLDAYQWVVIAAGEDHGIALTGNVNGSRPMDPAALARAVRASLDARDGMSPGRTNVPGSREGTPAADLPEPGERMPATGNSSASESGAGPVADSLPASGYRVVPATDNPPATDDLSASEARPAPAATGLSISEAGTAPDADNLSTPEAGAADSVPARTATRGSDAPQSRTPAAPTQGARGEADAPAREAEAATAAEESGDVKIYTISRSRLFAARSAQNRRASGEAAPGDAPGSAASPAATAEVSSPASCTSANAASPTASEAFVPAPAAPMSAESPAAQASEAGEPPAEAPVPTPAQTAARALGMDITRPWPGRLEPLRRLFATQAPLDIVPDAEHIYVRAPMPDKSGFDACLVGLRAEGGAPTGLRYALPGRRSPEPPPGLDGYRWVGDGEAGWWVTDADAF